MKEANATEDVRFEDCYGHIYCTRDGIWYYLHGCGEEYRG